MQTIAAGAFKDQCLKIMEMVAETGSPVVVTKRGRPVVRVVPYAQGDPERLPLAGSILREDKGDPFGTGEKWNADVS